MPDATRTLSRFELFAGLPASELRALEQRCRFRRYLRGAAIVDYNEDRTDVFFIVHGEVRVTIYSSNGREVAFRDLTAGELFGELSAIDGRPRAATVIALSECVLGQMPAGVFWEVIHRHQGVADAVLVRLVSNVRDLTERVFEFSTLAVRNRIHAELLRLARAADNGAGPAKITPMPTHSEIANRLSTHREAVSREINDLVRRGLIIRDGNELVIPDLKKFEQLMEEASEN